METVENMIRCGDKNKILFFEPKFAQNKWKKAEKKTISGSLSQESEKEMNAWWSRGGFSHNNTEYLR